MATATKRWLCGAAWALVQLAAPASVVAQEVNALTIARSARSLFPEDQQAIFRAIDAGDVQSVRARTSFVNAFQAVDNQGASGSRLNLEFTDAGGNTPLIRAALQNRYDIVDVLLDNGANINAQNAKWETALIVSYNHGYFPLAKNLLSRGADDPYNTAQLMQDWEAQTQQAVQQKAYAEAEEAESTQKMWMLGGGVAAAGAGVAVVALNGSKDSDTPSSSTSSAPSNDCGAGAGIHPEACSATLFQTSEAAAQEGVLTMRGEYAIAHGYDGRIFNRDGSGNLLDDVADGHVLVAVIDSGVDLDHSDLADNLRTDLAVTCTTSGCVAGGQDIDGHGTNVAGIIAAKRNGVGMHGVAPEAHIIPISAIGVSSGSVTASFEYANDHAAQVINNSWGLVNGSLVTIPIVDAGGVTALTPTQLRTFLTTTEHATTDLAEIQQAVAAHRLFVFSAGNDALAQPAVYAALPLYFQGATAPAGVLQSDYDTVNPEHYNWKNNWVASVSLNDSNTLSSFSHQCGVAKNWCLATPGEIAATTQDGGGYESNSGTSFSAPNVTGAIAVMLGAFPQLTPEAVLQVLFDTAADLGAAGVDDVYGRGLVDLRRATDPTIGGWTLSVGGMGAGSSSSSGYSSFSFSGSGIGLTAPFGNALTQNHATLIFQDAYNKDYTVPLSMVAGTLVHRTTTFDQYNALAASGFDQVVQLGEHSRLGFSAATPDPIFDKTGSIPFGKISYQSNIRMGQDAALVAFNYKTNMAEAMQEVGAVNILASNAMHNPYLRLAGSTSSGAVGYHFGATRMRVAAYSGTMDGEAPEYSYRFGSEKNVSGVVSEVTYSSADNTSHVAMENGVMLEENSFLGSEASGAFGVDKAATYFTGIVGRVDLADDVALIGNAHMGLTTISASNHSLFTQFGSVMTSAFALGSEFSNVVRPHDTLGFMLSQPLRVMRGSASLSLPVDVGSSGNVIYQNQQLNLTPSGRELDIEAYYHWAVNERSDLSVNTLFRLNPDNDNAAENDLTMLTKYKLGF